MDEVWNREEPDSPCIRICVLHPEAKLCIGCLRSGDEIANWPKMHVDERRKLLAELPKRAPLIKGKRRKRNRG